MLAKINRRYVPTYWDDFFNYNSFNNNNFVAQNGTSPAVNVIETGFEYRIDLAVPGLAKDDFKIDLVNEVLTISSEKKEQKEDTKLNYTRKEFNYSSFKRSFQLPDSVDGDNIKASHETGI